MSAIKWYVPNAVSTVFAAAALQSLVNDGEATSSEIDNSSTLDLLADFILAIQYATGPPTAGARIADIYLIPKVDGTNYPTVGSDGLPQKALFIGTFESRAASTSALEYLALVGITIPPGAWKIVITNVSGVTLHASASMFLKMRPYQYQSV